MGEVADTVSAAGKNIRNYKPSMKYRQMGSTGIYVSAFSIGTTRGELEPVNAGIERGVNFIHTSQHYMGGKGIELVAQAIKGRADKVHLGLKDNFDSLENALKTLGVNSVDFIFFARHNPDDLKKELPELKKRFMEWRDKGMVRFAGLTSHKHMDVMIDIAIEAGFFSVVMPTYGPAQVTEFGRQREALKKKGMSIVAMKAKGEVSDADFPTQITTALGDDAVTTVCKGVKTMEELATWTAAANSAKTGWLRFDYGSRHAYAGCAMCGACEGACPNGVAAADIVRCVRYYQGTENDPQLAAEQFAGMHLAHSLASCTSCGACEQVCPQRMQVRQEIATARRLWTAA